MSDKQFKVVLVGCGGMANGWMQNAVQMPSLKIVGLVDIRREAAEAMADKYQLPRTVIYPTIAEAIQKSDADMVFDVTIPGAHHDVVTTALRAGCNVLGEKPLSDGLQSAREMVAVAKQTGKVYAVMQNRRFLPDIRAVRNAVADKVVGDIEEVHTDFYIGAHFGGFRDVMEDVLIVDMAIHTFDQARFLSGCDPVAVYCHSYSPRHSWYKGHASALCIFEMTNGVVFSYRGSWCAEGLQTSWEASWRIIGSKGTILWDGGAGIKAQALKEGGKPGFQSEMVDLTIPVQPMEHTGHGGLIRDFVECIQTGHQPMTICQDNIKSLAMVMAAVESRKTGKRVQIEA